MDKDLNLTREQKIEKVIREGHEIAGKLRKVKNEEELDTLNKGIEEYADFVDENFGTLNEDVWPIEKECDLTMSLYIAIGSMRGEFRSRGSNPKARVLLSESDIEDFEDYLDSKDWVLESAE